VAKSTSTVTTLPGFIVSLSEMVKVSVPGASSLIVALVSAMVMVMSWSTSVTITASASAAVAVPLTAVALLSVMFRVSGESVRSSLNAVTLKERSVPTNVSS